MSFKPSHFSKSHCSMAKNKVNLPTLKENSLWKLTIFLQKEGYQSLETKLRIRFIQSKNYEPPQGWLPFSIKEIIIEVDSLYIA